MKHRVAAFAAAVLVCAAPAFAGMTFEATTTTDGPQGKQVMRTQAWVDGAKAKVVFTESDNPMFTEGAYLLTTDGGKTLYLVDPQQKTYMPFDLDRMVATAGAMMQSMGGMVKMSFSNQKVEKLLEEPGGQLLGRDTTHYRVRVSYDSEVRVMGMGQEAANETITDTWTTTSLADPGFSAWLRRDPPKTGIADLDALLAAEVAQGVTGVPLKTVSVTTTKDKKRGRTQTTTTTMEVTSLREGDVPAGSFEIPAGYEEVAVPVLPFGS